MAKKISVSITATGQWTWGCEVEMTRKEYDEYSARLDSSDRKDRRRAELEVLANYLDMRDIEILDDDAELEDFCEVPTKN